MNAQLSNVNITKLYQYVLLLFNQQLFEKKIFFKHLRPDSILFSSLNKNPSQW